MKLKDLLPQGFSLLAEEAAGNIMTCIIMRANYVPGVRHVLGWRGVADASNGQHVAWTAKIQDFSGIFGLSLDQASNTEHGFNSRFLIHYFPNPKEDLVENFSIQAIVLTQQNDYLSQIRSFPLHAKLCDLFCIGTIDLSASEKNEVVTLTLVSLNRQIVRSKDGVSLPSEKGEVQIVSPGGLDQDFPSYATAFEFFKVLAASTTFCLERPPSSLKQTKEPSFERMYGKDGTMRENLSNEVFEKNLFLTYDPSAKEKMPEKNSPHKDALWWKAHKLKNPGAIDKKALGIDDRPHLMVVTGFLGSGKTSFLNNFIEYQVQRNRFVAVIQNEIGKTGLDSGLLDQDFALVEMDEGCVCCTLSGNLKKAIRQISSSFQPDFIILETTGLANPFNLLAELGEVADLIRFDSVTTVVDCLNWRKAIEESQVALEQLRAADILLLNKTDLVTEEILAKTLSALHKINPEAIAVSASQGDINPSLLYGVDMHEPTKNRNKAKAHYHSHERDGLSSVSLELNDLLDRKLFEKELNHLPKNIFRAKGVVSFRNNDCPMLFQYVAGRWEISEHPNPNFSTRFMILIGQGLDEFSSKELLARLYA